MRLRHSKSSEILISFDAESRSAVDQIADVKNAEATSSPIQIQKWMYGCAFAMDGHRWNVLAMDMSKIVIRLKLPIKFRNSLIVR